MTFLYLFPSLTLSQKFILLNCCQSIQVDAVQKNFIKISELQKREKEEKKVLEKTSKNGGYLDEMDLPPCMSDEDEGGEWIEEEEEEDVVVKAGQHGKGNIIQGDIDNISLRTDPDPGSGIIGVNLEGLKIWYLLLGDFCNLFNLRCK